MGMLDESFVTAADEKSSLIVAGIPAFAGTSFASLESPTS
jgi:hypothetical protein